MSAQLNGHQKVLFQILCEFDRICRKHELRYILFAGTAIGAVRHQGFIPWDDDVDVAMLRADYDRFMQIAPTELDLDKYFLQKEFSEHWPMFFSKLRMNNTTCIEKFIPKDPKIHQGIYIDIFPVDNLSSNPFMQKIQFSASKIVIAKSLNRRGYLTDSKVKKLFMCVCKLMPMKPMLRICQKRKKNSTEMVHTFFAAAAKFGKNVFPRKWFTDQTELAFEGKKFFVSKSYDAMLKKIYGDYMVLPLENERHCKVHGVIVDLENSYEMYLETQKNMKITEYSRSIR